jgi:hypothetical protein
VCVDPPPHDKQTSAGIHFTESLAVGTGMTRGTYVHCADRMTSAIMLSRVVYIVNCVEQRPS